MSVSDHPIALRLQQRVRGPTKLLATVMGLPLVDGIFPALVIAGALTTEAGALDPAGMLQTGLLIFGGSATVAVILAEMDGSRAEKVSSVLLLGLVLIPVAVVEAAFAETLRSVLDFATFQRFAAVVILAIAAKTASAEIGTYLPSPGTVIALGLVASVRPAGAELVVTIEPSTLLAAAGAAGAGIAFALGVALAAPQLRGVVDLDRFRFGSSVALGMLAIEVLGLMPVQQPVALAVLVVSAVFAYDPDASIDAAAAPTEPAIDYTADAGSEDRPVDLPAELTARSYPEEREETVFGADGGTKTEAEDGPAENAETAEPERPPYL
ncbi:DUF5794 domain-containing protein [Halolamina salifodinae]|uniref:Uncharacterized protein n=1 Tax=Halolamina salifodinae TaxID=1202767 RepID=A0A8T4GYE6_9EURY|nr:DUF5794 domain-containing protein [Halolamina salifodinae]MBP1987430.1 hypothetical protein [Halolamina salifodinae]